MEIRAKVNSTLKNADSQDPSHPSKLWLSGKSGHEPSSPVQEFLEMLRAKHITLASAYSPLSHYGTSKFLENE